MRRSEVIHNRGKNCGFYKLKNCVRYVKFPQHANFSFPSNNKSVLINPFYINTKHEIWFFAAIVKPYKFICDLSVVYLGRRQRTSFGDQGAPSLQERNEKFYIKKASNSAKLVYSGPVMAQLCFASYLTGILHPTLINLAHLAATRRTFLNISISL